MIIRIGKASDNDFVVNDPHVSRYHAKLIREEGGCWLLEDLGSTNGTFVNGAQIVNDQCIEEKVADKNTHFKHKQC